ncbi:arginine ABC transporter substrate-binding protein [Legionella jordanis]|uniref:transporter substrate-binding domain-containing protein n=1 Tax=Legionella jordanis TaxID=456 RepID=UPI000EFDCB85|nr:transporter substrate-binding domain-containing protein [Legionella jordanis]RMX17896.1 arginine ABC transporter substrate-binding protein [Legionella jordanis]
MKLLCLIILLILTVRVSANQTFIFAVPKYDPPYVMGGTPEVLEGFDINLVKEICSRLSWNCSFKRFAIPDLFGALFNNEADYIIGGMVITAERRQQFRFSLPYMICYGGFTTLKESPIHAPEDLLGKKVGIVKEREYGRYLSENFGNKFELIPFDTYPDIFLALKNGQIDAIFGNYYSLLFLQHQYPDEVNVLDVRYPVGEGLGIATLPANEEQIKQINQVLLQIQADGTFVKLYNYNFEFFINNTN